MTTEHQPPAAPEAPQRSRRSKALTGLGWLTGVTPTKMAFQEVSSMARISGWALASLKGMITFNRAQAKDDAQSAKKDPERFWDELVVSANITERSLRMRYALAYWFSYLLFTGLAGGIGMVATIYSIPMALIGNVMLLNVLLIIYISNLHKLYTAREQKVITIPAFIKQIIKNPGLLFPIPLPKDFKLRIAAPPKGDTP